jgi:GT2 family glycosyltransferase
MNLSIIIVNWNSQAFVRQCLASIAASCRAAGTEIIVVDSGSYDGCGEMIAADFPAVRFIQSGENIGFARANNLAARSARGRHLLFLNPDTVLHEDTPGLLRLRLESLPRVGAIGCRLLNGDGSLQTSCVQSFPTILNQALDAQWLRERFPRSGLWGMAALFSGKRQPSPVAAVSGACLAVRREAFVLLGGFNESYFMYGEDLDLCHRLHSAGWRVLYTPETSVVHFGGGCSRRAPGDFSVVMMRMAVHRFIRVHQGAFSAGAYRCAMSLSALARLALLGPALFFGGQFVRHGAGSRRKWRAILRWSVGLSV